MDESRLHKGFLPVLKDSQCRRETEGANTQTSPDNCKSSKSVVKQRKSKDRENGGFASTNIPSYSSETDPLSPLGRRPSLKRRYEDVRHTDSNNNINNAAKPLNRSMETLTDSAVTGSMEHESRLEEGLRASLEAVTSLGVQKSPTGAMLHSPKLMSDDPISISVEIFNQSKAQLERLWDGFETDLEERKSFSDAFFTMSESHHTTISNEIVRLMGIQREELALRRMADKRELLVSELYSIVRRSQDVRASVAEEEVEREHLARVTNALRSLSVDIVEGVQRWRLGLCKANAAFVWRGGNYLVKMHSDLSFLKDVKPSIWDTLLHLRSPLLYLHRDLFESPYLASATQPGAGLMSQDVARIKAVSNAIIAEVRRVGPQLNNNGNNLATHGSSTLLSPMQDTSSTTNPSAHATIPQQANATQTDWPQPREHLSDFMAMFSSVSRGVQPMITDEITLSTNGMEAVEPFPEAYVAIRKPGEPLSSKKTTEVPKTLPQQGSSAVLEAAAAKLNEKTDSGLVRPPSANIARRMSQSLVTEMISEAVGVVSCSNSRRASVVDSRPLSQQVAIRRMSCDLVASVINGAVHSLSSRRSSMISSPDPEPQKDMVRRMSCDLVSSIIDERIHTVSSRRSSIVSSPDPYPPKNIARRMSCDLISDMVQVKVAAVVASSRRSSLVDFRDEALKNFSSPIMTA